MYNASLKTGFNKSIKKRKLTLYLSVTINKSRPAMIPQKKKAHNYIAIFCQTTKRVIKKIKVQNADGKTCSSNYEQYTYTYTLCSHE